MSGIYTINRKIEIDAGHRVMTHGSKCRNLHGHRYVIHAICQAEELIQEGEQEQMVLDFGFLKDIMMTEIHDSCDHGLIMCITDPILEHLLESTYSPTVLLDSRGLFVKGSEVQVPEGMSHVGKMILVDFIPTAEKLAEHWWHKMQQPIIKRSHHMAKLLEVTVFETPNCTATFRG